MKVIEIVVDPKGQTILQTKDSVAYYTSFVFGERTSPKRWGSENLLPCHGTGFGPENGSKRYSLFAL